MLGIDNGKIHWDGQSAYVFDNNTPFRVLDVPRFNQLSVGIEGSFLCVPTSLAMVEAFYRPDSVLASITAMADEINHRRYTDRSIYEHGGYLSEGVGIVSYEMGDRYDLVNRTGVITFDEIMREINNGNPILISYVQSETGMGHAIVIAGYLSIDGADKVIYNDPMQGLQKQTNYSAFPPGAISSGSTGTVAWESSYTTRGR